MPLDSKAKEAILKFTKEAIESLQESSFDGMRKLLVRLIAIADIFPDEEWSKELNLAALALGEIGAGTEEDFEEMDRERKDHIIDAYSEFLNSFYKAIEEEDISKVDDVLKEFVTFFLKEVGL